MARSNGYAYHVRMSRDHLLTRHKLVLDSVFALMLMARLYPVKDAGPFCRIRQQLFVLPIVLVPWTILIRIV